MSDNGDIVDSPEQDQENDKSVESEVEEIKNDIEVNDGIVRRSDKTVKQTVKDAKQRAIDDFKRGVVNPEYRVVKMANGKYRTYKRKQPLAPTPIKLNQVPENKRSSEVESAINEDVDIEAKSRKPKLKENTTRSQI